MNLTRRAFLKASSAAAAGGVFQKATFLEQRPKRALTERNTFRPRSAATVPALNVIAFNRMGFGPRPADWAAYDALGATSQARFDAYLAQQLNPNSIDDAACDARLAAQNFTTLGKSLTQLWADHHSSQEYSTYILPFVESVRATWTRAIYSRRQLFEALVNFWHDHFNVFGWHDGVVSVFVHYDRDVIRANALGNFRTLLEAVATSPAMLYYLDNAFSSNAGPNENWAREMFELHTLGVENYFGSIEQSDVPGYAAGNPIGYVDNDVYEAARAFTGWRVRDDSYDAEIGNTGEFFTYASWHDRFQKTVLGRHLRNDRPALEDGRAVLDAVASHPGTARHVCTKLCRRFIADVPPASVVDAAVATWMANLAAPDQLKRVLKTILSSAEFASTWGEKVKRPFELVASMLRATNANWSPSDDFFWSYGNLGQSLFEWIPPNGYPDVRVAWTGTNVMLYRWNIINYLIEGWVGNTTIDLVPQMPGNITSARAITDWWIQRLLGRAIDADDRAELISFMAQGRNPDYALPQEEITNRVPALVELILMFPDFQLR